MKTKLADAWAIGKERKMIVVKCISRRDKEMMENKKKLGRGKVYIENDLTWNERRTREKVVELAKDLRREGKK